MLLFFLNGGFLRDFFISCCVFSKVASRDNQVRSELPSFVSVGRVLIVLLIAEVLRPNLHIECHKYIQKSKTPLEKHQKSKTNPVYSNKYLLIVELKCGKILASFRELALLHPLAHEPSEELIEQRNQAASQKILVHESSD